MFSKMKWSKADGKTKKLGFIDEPCDLVLKRQSYVDFPRQLRPQLFVMVKARQMIP